MFVLLMASSVYPQDLNNSTEKGRNEVQKDSDEEFMKKINLYYNPPLDNSSATRNNRLVSARCRRDACNYNDPVYKPSGEVPVRCPKCGSDDFIYYVEVRNEQGYLLKISQQWRDFPDEIQQRMKEADNKRTEQYFANKKTRRELEEDNNTKDFQQLFIEGFFVGLGKGISDLQQKQQQRREQLQYQPSRLPKTTTTHGTVIPMGGGNYMYDEQTIEH